MKTFPIIITILALALISASCSSNTKLKGEEPTVPEASYQALPNN